MHLDTRNHVLELTAVLSLVSLALVFGSEPSRAVPSRMRPRR
jgi:hypothetical protein